MPAHASLFVLSLLVVACRPADSAPAEVCKTELVSEKSRGVIFAPACAPAFAGSLHPTNATVIGYFQPTAAEVHALEIRLRPALERGRTDPERLYVMPASAEDRAEATWG